jgi:hypothetical protein
VHEVEQAGEQRHAAGLVRGSHGHSDVRLHSVNSEKHLKIEEAEHKVEGGASGGREERDGRQPADDGCGAEKVGCVRQAAVVEVDGGLVLEHVAPGRHNVPHVRRHKGVAHERPLGEAHACTVARYKRSWGRSEERGWGSAAALPLTMVTPSKAAEACASFLTVVTAGEGRAAGRGRSTDIASHMT